ncbi:MAG: hypothetical protein SAK29_25355 [Scytonema sp. PMC 1069.18]|nr:hypothetical protein [Scytonema sp. PMC 1069.18]MEC4887894.1 hypothetical protein [Scytonema sp. PMC 1070.18]
MRGAQNVCLLPEAENQIFLPVLETSADLAIALLIHYSFDLSGYSASELVDIWEQQYPGNWLHLAVIEALYQGRYKAISVQQILTCWQRRGQAIFHFNMEFERLICSKFPQSLTELPKLPPAPVQIIRREEERVKGQEDKTRQREEPYSSHPNIEDSLPPVATINPPIEQFTPKTSSGSESFTSKLKAISHEKRSG